MTDHHPPSGPQDWADRHVARWRDHWIGVDFDDDTEAVFVRINRIRRHLQAQDAQAVASTGLARHEYETLHQLMIRDTPGTASPTQLAEELGISGAGMTGRLDALVKAGWVRRSTGVEDRRRVLVEITGTGTQVWRAAMAARGQVEADVAGALSPEERATLAALLRRLTLAAGDP